MIRRGGDQRGGLPLARRVDLRRGELSPPRYSVRRGVSQRGDWSTLMNYEGSPDLGCLFLLRDNGIIKKIARQKYRCGLCLT